LHQNFAEVLVTPQTECPDRIELEVPENLDPIASEIGLLVQRGATEALLAAVPPIDDWQLRSDRELPFGNDAPVSRFCVDNLEWAHSSPAQARNSSFGLFRWQLPYERHYYLRHRGHTYLVPVQVGKYLVLRHERRNVLTFDEVKQSLVVPVTCRPPMLVDRALTLRAGLLPDIQQGALIYGNVSRSIAAMTAAILRQ